MECISGKEQAAAGRVEHLFVKARHGREPEEVPRGDAIACTAGFGIEGDIHANRLSPRQILVTLRSQLNDFSIAPGSLHENMVISAESPACFRPGSALLTSGGVEIRLTMYCEPCKRIQTVVPDLGSLVKRRGVLGTIVKGGEVRRGDTIQLIPGRYAPLPESITQKFADFVATIPAGRVVRLLDVTTAMGVADSFVRAVPGYIKRSMMHPIPLHRIVNAKGNLLDFLPDQASRLGSEGIHIDTDETGAARSSVDLARYLWKG